MMWIWAGVLTSWTIGVSIASWRAYVRSLANGIVAVMTAADMQHAMAERSRAVELYDIIQRYVYMPKRETKPS
jgi:hypothetical protein